MSEVTQEMQEEMARRVGFVKDDKGDDFWEWVWIAPTGQKGYEPPDLLDLTNLFKWVVPKAIVVIMNREMVGLPSAYKTLFKMWWQLWLLELFRTELPGTALFLVCYKLMEVQGE